MAKYKYHVCDRSEGVSGHDGYRFFVVVAKSDVPKALEKTHLKIEVKHWPLDFV